MFLKSLSCILGLVLRALNSTLITSTTWNYPENNILSFFLLGCFNAQHKHMTSYQEKHCWRAILGMPVGQCVMLRNMMDGFQTKSKFEERAAERLWADDGWIGQLHRPATAHTAHNTSYHPKNRGVFAGNKSLLTHWDDKITSSEPFKIHKLLVRYMGCLLYSNKRENLISV